MNRAPILPALAAMSFLVSLASSSVLAQPATNRAPGRFPLPPGVKVLKDLEYGRGSGRPLLLDLYLPANQNDRAVPLLIWVHGGAWKSGSKDNPSPALRCLSEGYAVCHVGYRLSGEAKFPAQIYDCKAAVRWLRANASKYHLDADRFVAWGGSAGGHLVALLGTSAGVPDLEGDDNSLKTSSRVQAVIDWFGPTFLDEHEQQPPDGPVAQLLGGPVRENRDKAAQASPLTYVSSNAPPFLIMHGDQDHTVPIRQSEVLYAALKKASADATFLPIHGAGHGFGGARPELIAPVREFLRRVFK